jgi:hypothetical protein
MSSNAPQPPSAWKKSLSVVAGLTEAFGSRAHRLGGHRLGGHRLGGLDLRPEDLDELLAQVVVQLLATVPAGPL